MPSIHTQPAAVMACASQPCKCMVRNEHQQKLFTIKILMFEKNFRNVDCAIACKFRNGIFNEVKMH